MKGKRMTVRSEAKARISSITAVETDYLVGIMKAQLVKLTCIELNLPPLTLGATV